MYSQSYSLFGEPAQINTCRKNTNTLARIYLYFDFLYRNKYICKKIIYGRKDFDNWCVRTNRD